VSALLDEANLDQSAYWNGEAGRRWTAEQESQDRLLAPATAILFEAAAPQPGEAVIDIGCGAGETTLKAAALTGRALGVDVSEPMLARARERGAGSPARFILADATAYDFSAEAADLMISRFGVMFFAEPAKTFTNLRRGLKPGGRLAFVCWRAPAFNPWLMLPYAAAKPHLPPQPPPPPDAPGPFAFCDEARVRGVLEAAGFSNIRVAAREFAIDIADGGGLDAAVAKSLMVGPTSRALAGQPEAIRQAAGDAIRAALVEYVQGDEAPLGAAIWVVTATA
jgi:SAM-dependent methyltransferase